MHIFGITGPIGHGKTTFANALMELERPAIHTEPSMIISSIANEWFATFRKELLVDPIDYTLLNEWINDLAVVVSHQVVHIDANKLHINHNDVINNSKFYYKLFMHLNLIRQGVIALGETITEENKDRHRTILQWLGGFLVERVDKGIWFDEIERRMYKAKKDGVLLYVVGGVRYPYDSEVIRRNNGQIIKLIRDNMPERELSDITEEHRNEIAVDSTVISAASPGALNEVVKAMYNDFLLGDLLKEYNSNDFQAMA